MELLANKRSLILFYFLLFFPSHFSMAQHTSPCNATVRELLSRAFACVSGFDLSSLLPNCSPSAIPHAPPPPPLWEIRLPSRNLSGTVSWMLLRRISTLRVIDLSGNSLRGSIPTGFWSAPALLHLNLSSNHLGGPVGYDANPPSPLCTLDVSGNRFTNSVQVSGFPRLRVLDLSRNNLSSLPSGLGKLAELEHLDVSGCGISGDAMPLRGLRSLKYLDASWNRMSGYFPVDFPPVAALTFLNISFNNFAGRVTPEEFQRFGASAFVRAGNLVYSSSSLPPPSPSLHEKRTGGKTPNRKKPSRAVVLGIALPAALSLVTAIAVLAACIRWRRRRTLSETEREKKWTGKSVLGMEPGGATSAAWVAELTEAYPAVAAAPVVMFEKPLMRVTFSELAAATSGFGVESQLAEGRGSGPVYRAVLPGEMDVVIRVLEKAREMDAAEARAAFEELGRLRHPNILSLLGYCIAGREKLLLYEYMENGDLHRWLHELPAGHPDMEDWSTDGWDDHPDVAPRVAAALPAQERAAMGWATRHRIALGIARGLAFLHHAGSRPVVHGHLVPSNVLIDDDFEPRIADFGTGGAAADGSTEEDVYCYGSVLVELLTGRVGSPETVARVRRIARGREAARCLDPRRGRRGGGLGEEPEEREMVEALRVAFLCTAESPEKRPTMRHVVGLLKDVRPGSLTE